MRVLPATFNNRESSKTSKTYEWDKQDSILQYLCFIVFIKSVPLCSFYTVTTCFQVHATNAALK